MRLMVEMAEIRPIKARKGRQVRRAATNDVALMENEAESHLLIRTVSHLIEDVMTIQKCLALLTALWTIVIIVLVLHLGFGVGK